MDSVNTSRSVPLKVAFGGRLARPEIIQALRNFPEVELTVVDAITDVADVARQCEVLVISNPHGNDGERLASVINAAESPVRWVQIVSAGIDGLARYALPSGLMITNQGGVSASTVAEHVMALLLAKVRALRSIYLAMEHRVWDSSLAMHTSSLEGKQLTILGMGHVGRQLAIRASAFGMNVIGLARNVTPRDTPWEIRPMQQLHAVLASSDVVVACLALNDQTRHIMGHAEFSAMKGGAVFINVSRGEVVDTNALRDALQTGRLGSAAIDVVEGEPLDAKASLWDTPSLIISPHIAASGGTYSGAKLSAVVSENVGRYLRREPLLHLQDYAA